MPKKNSKPSGLGRLVLVWLAAALAVSFTSWLLPGVHVANFFPSAFLAALVIGAANAVIRPLLVVLTFPITIVTLGIFLLVINAAMLKLADAFLDGFAVGGWISAIIGAVVLSIATSILEGFFGVKKD